MNMKVNVNIDDLYKKCIGLNETLKVINPNSECELSLVRHMSDNLMESIEEIVLSSSYDNSLVSNMSKKHLIST